MLTGSSSTINVKAIYFDSHSEDVTLSAEYKIENDDIISIKNGRMMALKDGETVLSVSSKDAMGEKISKQFIVNSTTFPLTTELFNPSIWETGSFDEDSKTLITGKYGFGGWKYNKGKDISNYKYLVVKFSELNKSILSFRIFDEYNYWSSPALFDMNNKDHIIVDFHNSFKSDNIKLDPSHIYIVGFWSHGDTNIKLSDIYLTNSEEYEKTNDIQEIDFLSNKKIDLYNIYGFCIMRNVLRNEAIQQLPKGTYIIGNEKVMILR